MSPITERKMRKRKAESQDNERLSKRLSLLNLGMYYRVLFAVYLLFVQVPCD